MRRARVPGLKRGTKLVVQLRESGRAGVERLVLYYTQASHQSFGFPFGCVVAHDL